jgi:hypothetical protein
MKRKIGCWKGVVKLQHDTEVKGARVFLDAYFNAKEVNNKWSTGNIALRRNDLIG